MAANVPLPAYKPPPPEEAAMQMYLVPASRPPPPPAAVSPAKPVAVGPSSAGLLTKPNNLAQRELVLAQRERTLATYALDVAQRSTIVDERLQRDQQALRTERAALEGLQASLEQREKAMVARLKAAEEWESRLRERERAMHLKAPNAPGTYDEQSSRPLLFQEARPPRQQAPPAHTNAQARGVRQPIGQPRAVAAAAPQAVDDGDEEVAEEYAEEWTEGGGTSLADWYDANEYGEEEEVDGVVEGGEEEALLDEAMAPDDQAQEWYGDDGGYGDGDDGGYGDGGVDGGWDADGVGDEGAEEEEEEMMPPNDDDDWMAVRDDATSNVYYWNRRTNAVSWNGQQQQERQQEQQQEQRQREQQQTVADGDEDEDEDDDEVPSPAATAIGPVIALEEEIAGAPPALSSFYRRKLSRDELREPHASQPSFAPSPPPATSRATTPRRVVVVAPDEQQGSPSGIVRRLPPPRHAGGSPTINLPKWARESNKLREAMANARSNTGQPSVVPDDENDGRVECPHCKRRFSERAAERHVPQCSKLKTKPRSVGKPR